MIWYLSKRLISLPRAVNVALNVLVLCDFFMPRLRRFSDDIEFMTGRKPNIFWRVCWMGISPVMLLVVLVAYVVVQVQVHPKYPAWNPDYVRVQEKYTEPKHI